jgi:cation diffusion facilitator family transporter
MGLMSVPAEVGARGVRRVLTITLLLNLAVSGAKIVVGHLSGSLSMVADGYHSLVDGSNNVIGLIVAAFAWAPPDRGHPYGHRKFETAATTAIGVALLMLAWDVVDSTLRGVAGRHVPEIGLLNWLVMFATLGVNLFVSWYEAREGRRLGSDFLVADAAHTRADLYVSLSVLASFVGARSGVTWADPLVAAVIAGVITYQALAILVHSFHVLTDRAAIPSDQLLPLVGAVPGVRHCRDLRTRGRADAVYVDLVVEVDGELTLRAAHEVADCIEERLRAERPEIVDVVVHLEPAEQPLARP